MGKLSRDWPVVSGRGNQDTLVNPPLNPDAAGG